LVLSGKNEISPLLAPPLEKSLSGPPPLEKILLTPMCLFITLIAWLIATNLLQLFMHPENSQWFSTIFVIFEVNIVAEQKQA